MANRANVFITLSISTMKRFGLVLVFLWCSQVFGRYVPVMVNINDPNKLTRQQGIIGGWIQGSEWFPIEINIPDAISGFGQNVANFGQGISSGFMNLTNGFGQWIQQIPFFNRVTGVPRPFKYFVLVPANEGDPYNPFQNSVSNFIPMYP